MAVADSIQAFGKGLDRIGKNVSAYAGVDDPGLTVG